MITSYQSTNPVAIDGKWTTPNEWSDSEERNLIPRGTGTGTAFFRAKHDQTSLYVLLDYVTDTRLDLPEGPGSQGDSAFVYLDTRHSDGAVASEDDYYFLVYWNGTATVNSERRWDGSSYARVPANDFVAAFSLDTANDPYSKSAHLIYEFRIKLTLFAGSSVVGVRVVVWDHSAPGADGGIIMYWPSDDSRNPSLWADLVFASVPIPEFPTSGVIVLGLACVGTVLVLRAIRPRRR